MSSPPGAVELEVVERCDLCGSTAATACFDTRDRLHRLPGRFTLVRCDGCGLARLSPRPTPDALGRYYDVGDYLPHRSTGFSAGGGERPLGGVRDALRDEVLRGLGYPAPAHRWARPLVLVARRPLLGRVTFGWEGFPPHVPGGRVLDVGSGNGFFLAMLRHHGWAVQGVDLSASAAARTRATFGIDIHVGEITDPVFEPASFDFVHMSHVIEHVPSPTASLARVFELVRPGGLLYVETPNIASLGARLWGSRWFAVDSPRHLWLFTPATLTAAIERSGFRITRMRTLVWKQLAWEETYRWEERTGRARDPRPSIDLAARPRLAAAAALMRLGRLVAPRSGDILSCWAQRPM